MFRYSEIRVMWSCTENSSEIILSTVKLFYFRSPKFQSISRTPASSWKFRAHVFIPKGKNSSFLQSWAKRTLLSSKSCSSSKSNTRFWLSLCTTTVQLLFLFELLLLWCYCWCFWRGFISHLILCVWTILNCPRLATSLNFSRYSFTTASLAINEDNNPTYHLEYMVLI